MVSAKVTATLIFGVGFGFALSFFSIMHFMLVSVNMTTIEMLEETKTKKEKGLREGIPLPLLFFFSPFSIVSPAFILFCL
jgi:hypothetical protein